MRDVAARAGVGVGTVSRVVNRIAGVSPELRARVDSAITKIGFQRNEAARMLHPGQSSSTIGLIVDDLADPFASAVASGAAEIVADCDHVLVIGSTQCDRETERALAEEFIRRQVDGLLIVSCDHSSISIGARMAPVPVVYVDRAPAGGRYDRVLLDNYSGVKTAMNRLLDSGHRRIAYIGGSPQTLTGASRLQSYKRLLRQRGIQPDPTLIAMRRYTTDAALESAIALFDGGRPPTAIFADNHRITYGVAQAATILGADVALAGFDDLEAADLLPFELDLVTYSASDLGRRGAEQLFQRIDGDTSPATTLRVSTTVTQRGHQFLDSARC